MDGASEIRRLRTLAGGGENAVVELVEIDGQPFILKRAPPVRVAGERLFQRTMAEAGLPALGTPDHPSLAANELLLEYVDGSPTIGGSPTPDALARWGAAVAGMHGIELAGFQRFDTDAPAPANWLDYVDWLIERALSTPRDTEGVLPKSLLTEAARKLGALRDFRPLRYVLLHGDLHANNVLLRGDETVLFDRASRIWSGPAVYDLALVVSEGFPGARYGVDRPGDDARLEAFMAAYGELPADEAPFLDHFALAHALVRYPTPFVPELREIIDAAMALI
ncbi:MAG TPA: phosphotransferase [Caulobacteraceae bacterium]|nr:phosphotransferase [Caulobacteraceae bacterium]